MWDVHGELTSGERSAPNNWSGKEPAGKKKETLYEHRSVQPIKSVGGKKER